MRALTFAPEQIFPVEARHAVPVLRLPVNVPTVALAAIPSCIVPGFSPASFSGSCTCSGRPSGRRFSSGVSSSPTRSGKASVLLPLMDFSYSEPVHA